MAGGSSVAFFGRPMSPELFRQAHQFGRFVPTVHPQIRHQPAAAPQPQTPAPRPQHQDNHDRHHP
jgi:hypothetical protein